MRTVSRAGASTCRRCPTAGATCWRARIRSIGIDAWPTSDSDERTLELGGRVTSGDECYPQKITMGDFLRIIEDEGRENVAFLMPTANGPCRFGQYMQLIRAKFDELGYGDVPIISITSNDGYQSIGAYSQDLIRTAWRGVLAQDILMKALLKTRPYETREGPDRRRLPRERPRGRRRDQPDRRVAQGAPGGGRRPRCCGRATAFAPIPADYDRSRPLVGVVGEIFCRQNTFSNFDLIRLVEEQGGECWLSDIGEWVWYVDDEHRRRLADEGRRLSKEAAVRAIKVKIQRADEHALYGPWAEDFVGYEEPHSVREVLEHERAVPAVHGRPGRDGALDRQVDLPVREGRRRHHRHQPVQLHERHRHRRPIYPVVQRELDGLPIRVFYFDGTQADLERDVGIFIELARTYQRRKKKARRYPAYFARLRRRLSRRRRAVLGARLELEREDRVPREQDRHHRGPAALRSQSRRDRPRRQREVELEDEPAPLGAETSPVRTRRSSGPGQRERRGAQGEVGDGDEHVPGRAPAGQRDDGAGGDARLGQPEHRQPAPVSPGELHEVHPCAVGWSASAIGTG